MAQAATTARFLLHLFFEAVPHCHVAFSTCPKEASARNASREGSLCYRLFLARNGPLVACASYSNRSGTAFLVVHSKTTLSQAVAKGHKLVPPEQVIGASFLHQSGSQTGLLHLQCARWVMTREPGRPVHAGLTLADGCHGGFCVPPAARSRTCHRLEASHRGIIPCWPPRFAGNPTL